MYEGKAIAINDKSPRINSRCPTETLYHTETIRNRSSFHVEGETACCGDMALWGLFIDFS